VLRQESRRKLCEGVRGVIYHYEPRGLTSQVQRRAAGGAPAATLGKAAHLSREKCAAFQATRVV